MSTQHPFRPESSAALYRDMMARFLGPVIMRAFDDPNVTEVSWNALDFSTRSYESVITTSPTSGESKTSPASRGSRSGGSERAANSAGVR